MPCPDFVSSPCLCSLQQTSVRRSMQGTRWFKSTTKLWWVQRLLISAKSRGNFALHVSTMNASRLSVFHSVLRRGDAEVHDVTATITSAAMALPVLCLLSLCRLIRLAAGADYRTIVTKPLFSPACPRLTLSRICSNCHKEPLIKACGFKCELVFHFQTRVSCIFSFDLSHQREAQKWAAILNGTGRLVRAPDWECRVLPVLSALAKTVCSSIYLRFLRRERSSVAACRSCLWLLFFFLPVCLSSRATTGAAHVKVCTQPLGSGIDWCTRERRVIIAPPLSLSPSLG